MQRSPRQEWMAILARAAFPELQALAPPLPEHSRLRGPEVGMVMVRGRTGGEGAPFNLGEMTVTRCSIGAEGFVGHATIAGRDLGLAELAARLDAALQDPARHAALARDVLAPLAAAQEARGVQEARHAAATRVEFATLATMRG